MRRVSVIIPVFKAERYVRRAVDSALAQDEVSEVLLVEDGSPDPSFPVCVDLAKADSRVRLLTHPNRDNRGAGASRNLGLAHATEAYVAFLDADDVYLPGRFGLPLEMLEEDPGLDGVYEAVETIVDGEAGAKVAEELSFASLTTVHEAIPEEQFFYRQEPVGQSGFAHLNGWTLRRALFARSGVFEESLRLHQDSEMMIRWSVVGRFRAGRIRQAVASRRIHGENRITQPRTQIQRFRDRYRMWAAAYRWCRQHANEDQERAVYGRLRGHLGDFSEGWSGYFHRLRLVLQDAGPEDAPWLGRAIFDSLQWTLRGRLKSRMKRATED